jgi:predicted acyltransferase
MSVCYGINLFVHWFSECGTHPLKRKLSAIFMMGLVVLYMALMLTWSDEAAGCPKSKNLEPDCTIAGYVDLNVFGKAHLFQNKTPDPEGIVSTLTAAFTTYVGYIFGLMVQ